LVIRKAFTITAIGGTSVTFTPQTGFEQSQSTEGGNPGLWGTGTVVLTQGVLPDASYFKSAYKYLIEISRVA
jgi:hypothetical protein